MFQILNLLFRVCFEPIALAAIGGLGILIFRFFQGKKITHQTVFLMMALLTLINIVIFVAIRIGSSRYGAMMIFPALIFAVFAVREIIDWYPRRKTLLFVLLSGTLLLTGICKSLRANNGKLAANQKIGMLLKEKKDLWRAPLLLDADCDGKRILYLAEVKMDYRGETTKNLFAEDVARNFAKGLLCNDAIFALLPTGRDGQNARQAMKEIAPLEWQMLYQDSKRILLMAENTSGYVGIPVAKSSSFEPANAVYREDFETGQSLDENVFPWLTRFKEMGLTTPAGTSFPVNWSLNPGHGYSPKNLTNAVFRLTGPQEPETISGHSSFYYQFNGYGGLYYEKRLAPGSYHGEILFRGSQGGRFSLFATPYGADGKPGKRIQLADFVIIFADEIRRGNFEVNITAEDVNYWQLSIEMVKGAVAFDELCLYRSNSKQ